MERNISESHTTQSQELPPSTQGQPIEAKESLRVRCPSCSKPFVVKTQSLNVERPRFQCTACPETFWIPFPECLSVDEIIGFSVSWSEDQELNEQEMLDNKAVEARSPSVETHELTDPMDSVALKSCPKCSTPMDQPNQLECSHCGVLLKKAHLLEDSDSRGIQVKPEVAEFWKNLVHNFENRLKHREFVRLCERNECLDYAAMKYSDVLEGAPQNPMASDFLKQVGLRAAIPFESQKVSAPRPKRRRFFSLSLLSLLMGAFVCTMGFVMPEFRNLVGIGAAMICLTLAVRYYFS